MIEGAIRPCIKSPDGDIYNPTNFREVMISSIIFKLFEYSLLPSLKYFASPSSLQFGYRPNTSTILATAVVKEILTKFTSEGSCSLFLFLDLSKAFERVSHARILEKKTKQN